MPKTKTWPMLYKQTTGGKVQEWEISVIPKAETAEIAITYGLRDGKKPTTYETINQGKNAGKANATSAYDQAVKEAEAKWKKQQERRHYSTDATGGESGDKRSQAPMLAKSFEDYQEKLSHVEEFALQPKLDGFRCNAHWNAEEKTVTLVSREGKVFATMPHITAAVKALMKNEPSVILDGELWTPELRFSKIASAVKNLKAPPEWASKIQYHLYDVMADGGFHDRYSRLVRWLDGQTKGVIQLVRTLFVTERGRKAVDNWPDRLQQIKDFEKECVKLGFEGAMWRDCMASYEAGKRSKSLLKVKSFTDQEFKVIGWKKSKFKTMVTGDGEGTGEVGEAVAVPIFVCEMSPGGAQFDVLAPGTVKEKKAFLDDIGRWIGEKLTVKFFELTDDGIPRFPVAKAFR